MCSPSKCSACNFAKTCKFAVKKEMFSLSIQVHVIFEGKEERDAIMAGFDVGTKTALAIHDKNSPQTGAVTSFSCCTRDAVALTKMHTRLDQLSDNDAEMHAIIDNVNHAFSRARTHVK